MMDQLCAVAVEEREQAFNRILDYMAQAKLPKRSKLRKYPRAVWYTRQEYPSRRAQSKDAK